MADRNSPIGVFDSGVGGVSVLRACADLLPREDFLFFGDSANAPYGEKTLEQVRAVLADKSRAGHTAAIRDLLQKYGASKLSQVDPKNYEALLRDAEVLDHAT